MNSLFAARVGGVLSADVAVPEHEREARFYARVLSTGANPLWREADLMNNLGIPIIGLGPRSADVAHLPLQWMPHIQVADVAASVERAQALGGSVLMHATDADGRSQWAVLRDPHGAAFGIVPVVAAKSIPTDAVASDGAATVGHIAWLDLTVPNAAAARDFYQQVVGWRAQEVPMEDGGTPYADYAMLGGDGSPAAGVCHARGANAGLPPVWLIYLPVGDLAESLRRVEAEGGKVVKVVRGDDGAYRFAAIQDPVGICLALLPG
ncbi:MAG: VOC family protein [Chloroflexi bacterium OHK40]